MCKLKSGIIRKTDVYMPDHDHHFRMLEELNMADTQENAMSKFVRFEISPVDGDPYAPAESWVFRVDQDIVPDWFEADPGKYEEQARKKLAAWHKEHVFVGVDGLELSTGSSYYLKECKNVVLKGDAQVAMCNSSQVGEMWGSSQVGKMCNSSQVGKMYDSSHVGKMYDSSQVGKMCNSSQVGEMYDSSQVGEMWGSSQVGEMYDSSQVGKMCNSSQVGEMYDSSQVGEMWGSSQVGEMYDSSQVGKMYDSSQVGEMCNSSQVGEMWGSATARISARWADGVKPDTFIICDNATVKDNRTKTLYQSGDWKLIIVEPKKEENQ